MKITNFWGLITPSQWIAFVFFFTITYSVSSQPPHSEWPVMGLNQEWQELQKWTSSIPFNNLLKVADPFSGATTYDEDGYPLTGLPATSEVYVGDYLPVGSYKLRWDGDGEFIVYVEGTENTYSGVCPTNGQDINITNSNANIRIQINSTNNNNHLRNMRMYLPGYDDNSPHQFNDCYLDLFQSPIDVVRALWWAMVPSSTIQHWSDRPTTTQYSYGGDNEETNFGTAYEHMIDVANLSSSDLWICIPVMANDTFVTELATLIRTRLNSDLNIFVEYSNESTWNYWFEYHNNQQPQNVGLAGYPGDDGDIYAQHKYAGRSIQVLEIFDNVFGTDHNRLIGILGCQYGYFQPTADMVNAIEWMGKMNLIDAFAIAPYVGEPELITNHWPDMDAIFNAMDTFAAEVIAGNRRPGPSNDQGDFITDFYNLAATHQKKVVAYESGQHFVTQGIGGVGGGLNAIQVYSVNTHPRMYNWHRIYAAAWHNQEHTSTNVFYTSSAECSSDANSCFGMVTSCYQPLSEAHKFRGILDWAKLLTANKEYYYNDDELTVYPNPVKDGSMMMSFKGGKIHNINIVNVEGKVLQTIEGNSIQNNQILHLNIQKGMYIMVIETSKGRLFRKIIVTDL